jgi:two-component system, chemotaxis family, chemotaxis protein CheY
MGRILIVDDSEVFIEMIVYALKSDGYDDIDIALNGQDGLAKFNENIYDLILTDLYMPKVNGFVMVKKIREKNKRIPILMITKEFKDITKAKAKEIGVSGWIVKPFIPRQLTKAVSFCLSLSKS